MSPAIGDIYCIFVPRLEKYTACQITQVKTNGKEPIAVQLCLDWIGDMLPMQTELAQMKPLYADFMYWNRRLVINNVELPVPRDFVFAGNIPPLVQSDSNSYSGWDRGYKIYRQTRWQEISSAQRQQFKAAHESDETVSFAGREVEINSTYFGDWNAPFENALSLRALPCLSRLNCRRWYADLCEYLGANPFLTDLILETHGQKTLDFRGTHLRSLSVQMDGVETLYLGDEMEELALIGDTDHPFKIYPQNGGKHLLVRFVGNFALQCGLSEIESLDCRDIDEIDIAETVAAYPNLRCLELYGKPGIIRNFSALSALKQLKRLAIYDLFGFGADDIPAPNALPHLTELRMISVPEAAAQAAKKLYKGRSGLYLRILKGRKDEWLAENLDNPFRSWDGDDHISPANAKKAAALYKKTRKMIIDLTAEGGTKNDIITALTTIISEYTKAFNQMDKRRCFIETIEREQIYETLCGLLDLLPEDFSGDRGRLLKTFDEIRDF